MEFERQMEILAHSLEARGFTFTQYLDIFKGFAQAVKNIINDYFNNIHGQNLNRILPKLPPGPDAAQVIFRKMALRTRKITHRVSEIFFRDRIAVPLGCSNWISF